MNGDAICLQAIRERARPTKWCGGKFVTGKTACWHSWQLAWGSWRGEHIDTTHEPKDSGCVDCRPNSQHWVWPEHKEAHGCGTLREGTCGVQRGRDGGALWRRRGQASGLGQCFLTPHRETPQQLQCCQLLTSTTTRPDYSLRSAVTDLEIVF
ncbi:hypothetical protein J6590_049085 [Homalodisca vitripennis]|nr:hypothetical protein J6590_049085 [Homalodisca vitripennis]